MSAQVVGSEHVTEPLQTGPYCARVGDGAVDQRLDGHFLDAPVSRPRSEVVAQAAHVARASLGTRHRYRRRGDDRLRARDGIRARTWIAKPVRREAERM